MAGMDGQRSLVELTVPIGKWPVGQQAIKLTDTSDGIMAKVLKPDGRLADVLFLSEGTFTILER